MSTRCGSTPWLTDWLNVSRNVTLTLTLTCSERCFLCATCRGYKTRNNRFCGGDPCGGGFEYLHRDPASRRRRRKGTSQIWDRKIWSRVPRNSDPRKTTLASPSSIYKRLTRPLVREGAPPKKDRNCQTVINIWSWAPDGARHQDLLIDWPSVAMWLWLWLCFSAVWAKYRQIPAWFWMTNKGCRSWLFTMFSQNPGICLGQPEENNEYLSFLPI
jgi:hypothetical protein